jgi:hypothetical protein
MEDTQEIGDVTENNAQDKNRLAEEVAALKAQIEALSANQFQANNSVQPEQEDVQLTPEQAAAFQANPALFANWMKLQASGMKNEIRQESQKHIQDAKAYEKFPLLNTDKDFQKRVTNQMREMISQKEYTKNDPMLLFRASQIVAAEYAPARSNASKSAMSSVESRMTGQQSRQQTGPKIGDDDQQIRFAKLMGIEGAKLEKFRAQLTKPFEGSARRATRRFQK